MGLTQLISHYAPPNVLLTRALGVAQLALLFGLTTAVVRRRGETWRALAFPTRISVKRAAALVFIGYGSAVAVNGVLLEIILPAFHAPSPKLGAFSSIKGSLLLYLYWVAFAWISAAIGEELQFRAFLWSRLERLFGGGRTATIWAMVGQALVFGCAHIYQGVGGVLATGLVGLVMGSIALAARRNLTPSMILHGTIDTVSLSVAFLVGLPAALTH